jgi:three-Cys-motif partner protein
MERCGTRCPRTWWREVATPKATVWDRDPHTIAKHRLLERYLQAWFPIIAAHFHATGFTYVEGFAGPGEYRDGGLGSPLIALQQTVRPDVLQHGAECRLVFIEKDPKRFEHLKGVIEREFPAVGMPGSVKLSIECGECGTRLVPAMTAAGAWGGPIFANLDGWGADAPYKVVRRIGQAIASEVLVTFKDTFFTRFATVIEQDAGDRVFGDADWRQVATLASAAKKAFLVSQYRRRLNVAGFIHTLTFEMIDEGMHTLFLVFRTTSLDGVRKMKDALWTVDTVAGARFRDPSDPDQLAFAIDAPDFTPLRHAVISLVRSAGIATLEELRLNVLASTIYKESHVSNVVKELEDVGVLRRVRSGRSSAQKAFDLPFDGRSPPEQGTLL